ncbi:hypothetical protein CK623_11465 [Vandammella animalimorsus]|uniref:Uncharacterized protein n=2 Tax=Vandammella animalimorsus TaxID=2029117 RepID=A0A2A2AN68_9BURK|nr:hypothetical protein CK623_11465 [Vandammella animalimorsus]
MKFDSVIYMIESDPALSLVKRHIAERKRAWAEAKVLADEYGATHCSFNHLDGRLASLGFEGEPHPQFKKPRNGHCYPKKGSEAAAKFAALQGYEYSCTVISQALGVPLSLRWDQPDDGSRGWMNIGSPFQECGWLYLSEDGPYALWIPNVQAAIEHLHQQGKTVDPPAFDMQLPGCRRLLREEWDLLVAQHKLKQAQEAQP